jgi:hypothetical protein
MRARIPTLVVAVMALATLVACSSSDPASPPPLAGSSEAPPMAAPPPMPRPTVPPDQPPEIACFGVPEAKCTEMVAGTADDLAVPTFRSIRIVCRPSASCTMRTGSTDVEAILLDGTRVAFGSSWHTAGDPEPLPIPSLAYEPVCIGLDRNHCSAEILEVLMTTPDDAGIRGIEIRCVGHCTPVGGEARTVVTFVHGRTTTREWAYGPSG